MSQNAYTAESILLLVPYDSLGLAPKAQILESRFHGVKKIERALSRSLCSILVGSCFSAVTPLPGFAY